MHILGNELQASPASWQDKMSPSPRVKNQNQKIAVWNRELNLNLNL